MGVKWVFFNGLCIRLGGKMGLGFWDLVLEGGRGGKGLWILLSNNGVWVGVGCGHVTEL